MNKIPYKTVYSKRKTVSLTVDREGEAVVRAPVGYSQRLIEKFVSEHADWIEKQLARYKRSELEAGSAGVLSPEDIKRLAESMRSALEKKLPVYATRLGVTYNRVTIRAQKTKWGSCTREGNLNFNCLLMLAPEEVLDYVIVHELCHRKHMDHSKEFWADVERLDPCCREHKKWLREYGPALMMRAERKTHA